MTRRDREELNRKLAQARRLAQEPSDPLTRERLAQLIEEEFAIRFNPRSLSAWLKDRGFTPQKPERVPRERDPKAIAAWLDSDWPRIKKKPGGMAPTSP